MSEKASTYLLSQTRGRKSEKQMAASGMEGEREEEGRVMICQPPTSIISAVRVLILSTLFQACSKRERRDGWGRKEAS